MVARDHPQDAPRPGTCDALPHPDTTAALFSETAGRFVVEIAPADVDAVREMLDEIHVLGSVSAGPMLDIVGIATVDVARLTAAFAGAAL